REARGTLCQRLMPRQEAGEKKSGKRRDDDRTDFAYWDWDKKAFRAFRAENVVRICAVSIPNYIKM
ncbi:MAG: SH3 beta-barrel fold-containing protein, partial [Bacteroidales bacterium]|nr:SH3 beta-barrel fold-containing protein [Bacteroidales bacterium]